MLKHTAKDLDCLVDLICTNYASISAEPRWKLVDLTGLINGIVCGPLPGDEDLFD